MLTGLLSWKNIGLQSGRSRVQTSTWLLTQIYAGCAVSSWSQLRWRVVRRPGVWPRLLKLRLNNRGLQPCNPQECQNSSKIPNFILQNIEKQMTPCKSTAEEVSFEWSHHRISSTDSKVRTALHVYIIDSGSETVTEPTHYSKRMGT